MTAREQMAWLDKTADYPIGNGLVVEVVIRDVKQAWGDTRVLISPKLGTGESWVSVGSIRNVH